jgi:hypothetical protein
MAAPKRVAYFKAKLEDKPGAVLAFTQLLKSKNIGLSGLWGYGTQSGEAEVVCIPKNPDKFRTFVKTAGLVVQEGTGFLLKGTDKTGALVKPFQAIAKAGVNVISGNAMAAGGSYTAFLQVGAADIEKTGAAIGAK